MTGFNQPNFSSKSDIKNAVRDVKGQEVFLHIEPENSDLGKTCGYIFRTKEAYGKGDDPILEVCNICYRSGKLATLSAPVNSTKNGGYKMSVINGTGYPDIFGKIPNGEVSMRVVLTLG